MIHFYQKPILRGAGSEAWLNEMSSEVAEDLIADKMEGDGPRSVDYDDPTAGEPGSRPRPTAGVQPLQRHPGHQVGRPAGELQHQLRAGRVLGAQLRRRGAVQRHRAKRALRHRCDRSGAGGPGARDFVRSGAAELGGSRTTLGRHLGTGPVPLQRRRLDHLTHRRHGVPAGLDRPAPLRIRAAPGAGPVGLGGAYTCTHRKG